MARRSKSICPPGILCISPNVIAVICVIITSLTLFYVFFYKKETHSQIPLEMQAKYLEKAMKNQEEPTPSITNVVVEKGDSRYTRAPKPLRDWMSPGVDLEGSIYSVPQIATRGLPETYQSMGIVHTASGELLPLFGRRVASRSDRFNYYTRTDTNNPIPLPINYKKRNCQDDVGCDELFDGDEVDIAPTNQKGRVTVYRFNGPTYIPGLI